MMAVEVETPEDYAGNVMGDLSSRRGMVQGMEDMVGGGKAIKAEVPLSEMFGYSTTLRSMSQGRATYTMEFKHYTEAPQQRRRDDHRCAREVSQVRAALSVRQVRLRPDPLAARGEGTSSRGADVKPIHGHCSFWRFLKWQKANSSGPSRTSTWAPSATWTMARRP